MSEADSSYAASLKDAGNKLMSDGNFSEAIQAYSSATELDPNNVAFYHNRAAAHYQLNDYYATVLDCNAALCINPDYAKAFTTKAIALSALGNYREAYECFEEALRLDPDNEEHKRNLEQADDKLTFANRKRKSGEGQIQPRTVTPVDMNNINLDGLDVTSFD